MVVLLDLSTEILEQIFFQQYHVEDMVSLGTTCFRLHQVLSKPNIWRDLLTKAQLVTVDNSKGLIKKSYKVNLPIMQMLMSFLKTIDDPWDVQFLLHDQICMLYPGLPGSSVSVSCLLPIGFHTVSSLGLQLLALTGEEGHRIDTVHLEKGGPIIGTLSSLAFLAGQIAPVEDLEITGTVCCTTEEEGQALVSLLKRCSSWRLGELDLEDGVGREAWQGLGKAASCGRLEEVRARREVVESGRREDLRKVWEKTVGSWLMEGRQVAWPEIEQISMTWVQKVKRVLCCQIQQILLILAILSTTFTFLFVFYLIITYLIITFTAPKATNADTSKILKINAKFSMFFALFSTFIFYLLAIDNSFYLKTQFAKLSELFCICPFEHLPMFPIELSS